MFAIGSPLGLERTVTQGILSTKTRQIEGELYLQTSTQINPGNSGGPLFNLAGEVVGVTNMKITMGEGLGFAIPVELVKNFLDHRDAFAYAADNPNNPYRYLDPPSRTKHAAGGRQMIFPPDCHGRSEGFWLNSIQPRIQRDENLMKKFLAVLLLAFAAVFNSFSAPANPPPASAEQLRSALEAALKAGDTNAILSLYNRDGVSNSIDLYLSRAIQGWSAFRSKYPTNRLRASVWLWPLRDDYETEGIINGIRYRPNVSVVGMIDGSLSVDDNGTNTSWGTEFPYGEKNGGFYFAGTITEKIYEPKEKEKPFLIAVTSTNRSALTSYAISYVYLQNNQEIKKTFTGTNTFQRYIWANELKSCILRKLSDDKNSLKLEISGFSTNKFLKLLDSETSSTNTTIIYERTQP